MPKRFGMIDCMMFLPTKKRKSKRDAKREWPHPALPLPCWLRVPSRSTSSIGGDPFLLSIRRLLLRWGASASVGVAGEVLSLPSEDGSASASQSGTLPYRWCVLEGVQGAGFCGVMANHGGVGR